MGQILEQYNAKGKRNDLQPTNIKDGKLSQKEVAQSIGLSQRQPQPPDQSFTISPGTPKYF